MQILSESTYCCAIYLRVSIELHIQVIHIILTIINNTNYNTLKWQVYIQFKIKLNILSVHSQVNIIGSQTTKMFVRIIF